MIESTPLILKSHAAESMICEFETEVGVMSHLTSLSLPYIPS